MANIHEHAVLSDVLERKGSGFTAHHGDDFLMANNAQWVGFSIESRPGWRALRARLARRGHLRRRRAHITRPDESSGSRRRRRWRERLAWPLLGPARDGRRRARRAADEPSDWHARRARVILQGRAAKGTLTAQARADLMTMFQTAEPTPDWRLRAMWALHVTGGWTSDGARRKRSPTATNTFAPGRYSCSSRTARRRLTRCSRFARNGARRTLGGRAPVSGVGAAAPRSRGALEHRRWPPGARRRCRRSESAEAAVAGRRAARRRQSVACARAHAGKGSMPLVAQYRGASCGGCRRARAARRRRSTSRRRWSRACSRACATASKDAWT